MNIPGYTPYRYGGRRFVLLWTAFLLLFAVLVGGLWTRQVWQAERYQRQEARQSLRRIIYPAPRGLIYDRKGRLLVGNRARFSLAIYLNELRAETRAAYLVQVREARKRGENTSRETLRQQAYYDVISRYLGEVNRLTGREYAIDPGALKAHFKQRLLLPFILATDLSLSDYARLLEGLPLHSPLQIITDSVRTYPYGTAACHVLGYVGWQSPEPSADAKEELTTFSLRRQEGKTGVEKQFDALLEGQEGCEVWQVDLVGFQHQCVEKTPVVQGQPLRLSLDIQLQDLAQKALRGRKGAVVGVEVKTGEVVILASSPDYDPNTLSSRLPSSVYQEIEARGAWINRALQGAYPPGSIFKVITAAAALKNKVITLDSAWGCGAFFRVGNRLFPEHERRPLGFLDVGGALALSSNVFFYDVALRMGVEALAREARFYGLDHPTGIELPYESTRMVVPDPAWKRQHIGVGWRGGDTANFSIGQGYLLVTPLQMACFAAAFARGVPQIRPTLLHQEDRTTVAEFPFAQKAQQLGLTPEQYQGIIDGLEQTTLRGTGRLSHIPGLRTATKTGTAQVHYGSGAEMTLAWSLQFAPLEDPELALVVMVEGSTPNDGYNGGTTSAPIARALLKAYFGL